MRSEEEMFDLILDVAKKDPNIRAVYMNGSRVNPNVPKDIFQDFDICYVVTETKPYIDDEKWIDCFGERLMLQMPDKMDALRGRAYNFNENYGWLIQLADGNRLDLLVESISFAMKNITMDKLCVILLDKDNFLPEIPDSTDADYHVKKPSQNDYLCDCNNFWWCLNNVAKGLWREEVPYVMDMINDPIRIHLKNILSWKIGIDTDFSVSVGKSGKYMYRYLPEEMWERYLRTYSDGQVDNIWEATLTMCDLFEEVAIEVADQMGYTYNQNEADSSRAFLEHVRNLPKDATEIF
ncbi:MAG: aminoglycoside 6-adenylyltransferase [Bacillota bacterium]|nr:aminoglycoside 6-adenylyltransferase [Bacillota bacterium]